MNYGHFAGRLGRDAESRATPNGKSVCNFSIGVDTGWGENKKTLWVGCALWGERGEKLVQYLTKGTAVAVAGEIDIRTYQAKDGSTKAELTCNVQKVTLLGGGEQRAKAEKPAAKPAQTVPDDLDDNIPFAFLLAPLAGLLIAAATASEVIATYA